MALSVSSGVSAALEASQISGTAEFIKKSQLCFSTEAAFRFPRAYNLASLGHVSFHFPSNRYLSGVLGVGKQFQYFKGHPSDLGLVFRRDLWGATLFFSHSVIENCLANYSASVGMNHGRRLSQTPNEESLFMHRVALQWKLPVSLMSAVWHLQFTQTLEGVLPLTLSERVPLPSFLSRERSFKAGGGSNSKKNTLL